jgi:hypothetical protein
VALSEGVNARRGNFESLIADTIGDRSRRDF